MLCLAPRLRIFRIFSFCFLCFFVSADFPGILAERMWQITSSFSSFLEAKTVIKSCRRVPGKLQESALTSCG